MKSFRFVTVATPRPTARRMMACRSPEQIRRVILIHGASWCRIAVAYDGSHRVEAPGLMISMVEGEWQYREAPDYDPRTEFCGRWISGPVHSYSALARLARAAAKRSK